MAPWGLYQILIIGHNFRVQALHPYPLNPTVVGASRSLDFNDSIHSENYTHHNN